MLWTLFGLSYLELITSGDESAAECLLLYLDGSFGSRHCLVAKALQQMETRSRDIYPACSLTLSGCIQAIFQRSTAVGAHHRALIKLTALRNIKHRARDIGENLASIRPEGPERCSVVRLFI